MNKNKKGWKLPREDDGMSPMEAEKFLEKASVRVKPKPPKIVKRQIGKLRLTRTK